MSSFPRRNASAVLRDVFARQREKWSRAEERKKNTFFSPPHLSSSGHRRRNLTVSPLSPAGRVTTKRGKRETVRGDARVDVRARFFLLGSGPLREKSRVSRKSRHSRRRSPARHPPRSASSSAEARRWSSSRRASDRARVHAKDAFDAETHPLRRLFWNKSSSPTEVSKRAGLIAFVPHRGVSSFRRLSRKRHARQSDKNGKSTRSRTSRSSATSDGSVERALEATRGRPRRRLRFPRARRRLRRAVGSKFMLSNRQKAGKGFGRTGAACVVVTPRERGGGGGSEARKANAAGIEKRGGGFAGRGGRCHASAARTARIASLDPGERDHRRSFTAHARRAARRRARNFVRPRAFASVLFFAQCQTVGRGEKETQNENVCRETGLINRRFRFR